MSAEMIAILAVGVAVSGLLFTGLRGVRADMGALRTEMRTEMGTLRAEMRADMADLRNDIQAVDRRVQGLDLRVSRLEGKFDIVERYIFGRNETGPEPAE